MNTGWQTVRWLFFIPMNFPDLSCWTRLLRLFASLESTSHSCIYLEPETSSGWQTLWINVVCKLCAIFVIPNSPQQSLSTHFFYIVFFGVRESKSRHFKFYLRFFYDFDFLLTQPIQHIHHHIYLFIYFYCFIKVFTNRYFYFDASSTMAISSSVRSYNW